MTPALLRPTTLATVLALSLAATACATRSAAPGPGAPAPAAKAPTMQDVLTASTPADWRTPDPEDTLYLDLEGGRRVIIELAPRFAPRHVANIRTLVRQRYFDGLSINRSHDNFVVQWGDANGDDPAKTRPLGSAAAKLDPEFTVASAGIPFTRLPDVDGWAPEVGFSNGLPVARDPKAGLAWPAHCYGTLGVGRGMTADSGNGGELYVVIGQAPRQLDRNITTVGRVLSGMEWLSALPRGTGPLGFYEQPAQRVAIVSIRLASELPEAERARFEVFRTDTPAWEALVESRRNRKDDWYLHPANHIDLCSVPLPVRVPPAG